MPKMPFLPMIAASLALLSACGLGNDAAKTPLVKLGSSVDTAIRWADRAIMASNATSTPKDLIQDVREVLDTRQINLVPKGDSGPCADNTANEFTLAYVKSPITTNPINVCHETMTFSEAVIAQVLVHEAVHGANVTDECTTTSHELNIMKLSAQKPFKNAYVDTCNLGSGTAFTVLDDDGVPVPVRYWREDGPQGARYIRAKRAERTLQSWIKYRLSFWRSF